MFFNECCGYDTMWNWCPCSLQGAHSLLRRMGHIQEEPERNDTLIHRWSIGSRRKKSLKWKTPGLKNIHLADLNLLTAISLLSWRHNNIWNLKREEKFNLHLKFCIWIHTWANMGTVSGRTGTKTEVSAGTFVELFGAVVTWKLLHIFIKAIFNETGKQYWWV